MLDTNELEFDLDIDEADDFDYDNSGKKIKEEPAAKENKTHPADEQKSRNAIIAKVPPKEQPPSALPAESAEPDREKRPQRKPRSARKGTKRKVKKVTALILAVAAFACSIVIYFRGEDMNYTITRYQVSNDKIESDIRIVFLSDLHEKEYGEDNAELVQSVQDLKPDLIILGGDFVSFPYGDSKIALSLFSRLKGIAPCYAVLGNHEMEEIYSGSDETLAERISATGVTLLRNENCTIELDGNTINLVGLEGATKDYELYGEKETVDGLTDEYDGIRICVCHVPDTIVSHMQDSPVDLYLAGHTHGGLMNLPIVGRLYTREEGIFPKYAYGEYSLKSGAKLIIGGGLGDSHNVVRIGNEHEVVLIDISGT